MTTPNTSSSAPSNGPQPSQSENSSTAPEGGYPEQKHAGAVGLGPEYGKGASGFDKVQGYKEELVGKILHNPQKVQHGHDLRTGELKRREREEGEKSNPFQTVDQDEDNAGVKKDDENAYQPGGSARREHLTPKGEKEQAATIAPEGTEEAELQREGQVNPKTIG